MGFIIFVVGMSDERLKNAAVAAFLRYLEKNKLRKTPERFAILDKVYSLNSHFFIDSLYHAVVDSGYHVSRTTVYNTVDHLVNAGIIRRHNFANQPTQYEKISGVTGHHHLVCTRCGKIKEMRDAEIDSLLSSRHYGTFSPQYADLYIYGLCAHCQKQSKIETSKISK